MPDSPGKSVMTEITGMTGIPGAGPALNSNLALTLTLTLTLTLHVTLTL